MWCGEKSIHKSSINENSGCMSISHTNSHRKLSLAYFPSEPPINWAPPSIRVIKIIMCWCRGFLVDLSSEEVLSSVTLDRKDRFFVVAITWKLFRLLNLVADRRTYLSSLAMVMVLLVLLLLLGRRVVRDFLLIGFLKETLTNLLLSQIRWVSIDQVHYQGRLSVCPAVLLVSPDIDTEYWALHCPLLH